MNPSTFQLALSIGTVVALISIAYGVLKQSQKQNEEAREETKKEIEGLRGQLNNVGSAMRNVDRISEDRYFAVCIAMLLVTPKDRQKDLADVFLSGRHR